MGRAQGREGNGKETTPPQFLQALPDQVDPSETLYLLPLESPFCGFEAAGAGDSAEVGKGFFLQDFSQFESFTSQGRLLPHLHPVPPSLLRAQILPDSPLYLNCLPIDLRLPPPRLQSW